MNNYILDSNRRPTSYKEGVDIVLAVFRGNGCVVGEALAREVVDMILLCGAGNVRQILDECFGEPKTE